MIEELKMILDLLGGVQEDAYSLVVMYMVFTVMKWAVLSGAVIYFLNLIITKLSEAVLKGSHEYKLRALRDAMGVGCAGSISSNEIVNMMNWVHEKKEKN